MLRYFLELSYKGKAYSGFQIQENAQTIQGALQQALEIFFRQTIELTGSSRTDAGVNARQNFFHFDTDLVITSRNIYNLNALLPEDISIRGIYQVPENAHCRFDAIAREYKYILYKYKDPFMVDRGWHYPYPIDLTLMQEAADLIKDYSDFTSFSKRNTQVNNFICNLTQSSWRQLLNEDVWEYTVTGNRFLRGMVRGLVGTMLKVGRGQISVKEFSLLIEARDCTLADFSTPPQGLFLEKVLFKDSLKELLK